MEGAAFSGLLMFGAGPAGSSPVSGLSRDKIEADYIAHTSCNRSSICACQFST